MNETIKKFAIILGIIICAILILIFAVSVMVTLSDIPYLDFPLTTTMPVVFFLSVIVMLVQILKGLTNLYKRNAAKKYFSKSFQMIFICIGLYFSVRPINRLIQVLNIRFSDIAWCLVIFALIGIIVAVAIHEYKKSPEQRKEEKRELYERHVEQQRRLQAQRYNAGKVIVEVKLLSGGSIEYHRGGIGGAIVGGLLGGPIGAAIGATMPNGKGEQKQKFAVKYSDGKVVIKELHPNSWEYKELIKHVEWQDI